MPRIRIKEKTILVFHSSTRASWQATIQGIGRFARTQKWRLQVIEYMPDRKALAELLKFWHPDGIIAECAVDEKGVFVPKAFGRIPVVYLVSDPRRLKPSSLRVNHDSNSFGRLAAKTFLSSGLKSFAYLGYSKVFWSIERGRAFSEAIAMNGYECNEFSQPLFELHPNRSGSEYNRRLAKWLASLPKPCGLLVANDALAIEAINTCRSEGISVPDDISVLGIDNDEPACENSSPTLSSMQPNFDDAGYISAELLSEALAHSFGKNGAQRVFPASDVVHRASTLRLPHANASISAALEMIRLKACTGIKARDVLKAFPGSRRTLELRFKELTGHTVLEEILSVRLARVKELVLQGDVPLEAIAKKCGWRSSARLRVFFREAEGMSMHEWKMKTLRGGA